MPQRLPPSYWPSISQCVHCAEEGAITNAKTEKRERMRGLVEMFTQRGKKPTPQPVVVVSGLPRSGTSMMMAILEAGGMPVLTDRIRSSDDDNPKGYYEFERVKQLDKGDTAWLPDAEGKAVKIISALLVHLPPTHTYQVLFMQRRMKEVLDSQRVMLLRRGKQADPAADDQVEAAMSTHVIQVLRWLEKQPNFRVLEVDYNHALTDGKSVAQQVNAFLGGKLIEERMSAVIDRDLYRNRG